MKSILYLTILFSGLFLLSCNESGPIPETPEESGSYRLNIQTVNPGIQIHSRSEIKLGDPVYAYPFRVNDSYDGVPVSPDSIRGNYYSYIMPARQQDIIFTNLLSQVENEYLTEVNHTDYYLKISLGDSLSGSPEDLVIGTLSANDQPDSTQTYPVELVRQTAELSIGLKALRKSGDTINDLSAYFTRACLYVGPLHSTCTVDPELNVFTSGEIVLKFETPVMATREQILCENRFSFPSPAEKNPELKLRLEYPNGNLLDVSARMTHPLEANNHYKLTLILKQKTSEFEFNLEDFTEEKIEVGDFIQKN